MSDSLSGFLGRSARERNATQVRISEDRRYDALLETLMLAVPLRIWEMRDRTAQQRAVIAKRCAQVVAERGDNLMFGSKRRGEAAQVFNALAEGLAAAAFQPGGVRFAGRHWCTDHSRCVRAETGMPDEPHPDAVSGECGDGDGSVASGRDVETVAVAGGLL